MIDPSTCTHDSIERCGKQNQHVGNCDLRYVVVYEWLSITCNNVLMIFWSGGTDKWAHGHENDPSESKPLLQWE